MIYGIDVSAYQSINFPLTSDGHPVDFVFIKATEGHTSTNSKQRSQAAWARDHGLVVGFYHFLWPGNIAEQARYFVDLCDSVPGDLLACDWETTGAHTLASNAEKDAFLREVKKLRPDHQSGLYCGVYNWTHHDSTSYVGDFLWIADPNHAAGHPGIQHRWTFQQYSSHGDLDRNVAAFASRDALRAWAESLLEDSVALSDDDVQKVVDGLYDKLTKTQFTSVPAELDKDGHWSLPTVLGYLVAQTRVNGTTASAVQAALAGLDPAAVEQAIVDKVKALKLGVVD